MSYHSDEDADLSQDEDENLSQNAFVTDNADVHLSIQQQFEDIEPIEARPPYEIDADEQERLQSGTPAFRTLEDV
jgi:hypothetical protein